jgi:uncharacterized protein YggU (UPF0235/DUF167 family)
VTAPAEHGKANAAVEKLLADALGVPGDHARVVAGQTSPRKVVEIAGLSEAEVRARLEETLRRAAPQSAGRQPE